MRKKFAIVQMLLALFYWAVICVHVFLPKSSLNIKLSTKIFFAQFYAFPILFGTLAAAFSLIVLLIGLCINKSKWIKSSSFRFWMAIFVCSAIFAVFGSDFKKQANKTNDNKIIKIVEWNALNNLTLKQVSKIFKEYDADIAVFPELGGYNSSDFSNQRIKDLFDEAGVDYTKYEVFLSPETAGSIAPVTIIVKKGETGYEAVKEQAMTTFGTVFLKSKDANKPDIVGLHTAPPLPALMNRWKWDLELISSEIMRKYSDAIIVGDFNATVRHGALNEIDTHEDALNYAPKFLRGTWHVDLPLCFRTTIDHVFIPKGKYSVKSVEITDFAESDHACVYVEAVRE